MNIETPEVQARQEFIRRVAETGLYKELVVFLDRMLRNRAIAEEIAQDTYVKLNRLVKPKEIEKPRALLFDAATKVAIDHIRRMHRDSADMNTSADDSEIEAVPDVSPFPDDAAASEQQGKQVAEAVEKLPLTLREVFVMRYVRRVPSELIADKLQISVDEVLQRLTRALAAVRGEMVLRGYDDDLELSPRPMPSSESGGESLALWLLAPFGGFLFASIYR